MADRRDIRLADDDLIASAQILGWLAFPARPQHGVSVIQQWAIRRQMERGELTGKAPIRMDKPSRLQARIYTLDHQLCRRLKAGDWLAQRMGKAAKVRILPSRSLSALAKREGGHAPNIVRDYWTASVPVIHLAKAALFAILEAYRREPREHWHLERTIFWPNWVQQAIEDSENAASWAERLGLVEREKLIRFHCD